MLNVGWPELMVIGVVALLVIGPRDLPEMFRQVGRFTAKIRSMGRDFQRAMDEAARQAGVNDVAKDLKSATSAKSMGLDGLKSAADKFEKWDPIKNAAKPTAAPKPATPTVSTPAAATTTAAATAPAVTPPASAGPATQALYAKQAAKADALREYNAKVRAIEDGTLPVTPAPIEAKPARKPRAAKATPEANDTPKPARKPRAAKATPEANDTPKPAKARKKKVDEA